MSEQIQKLTPLKKAMGKQMIRSLEAPQFQLETEVDCTRLIEYRKNVGFKPTFTTILAKLVADTLLNYPNLNSSWGGDCIVMHDEVNIGIAVDTKRGLLVPVIQNAAKKTLLEIHKAMEEIKAKRDLGNFTMDEMSGGTFTITNLGAFNITSFKAIVNVPEVGILAVSKMADTPVVRNGQIVSAKIMRICLSIDHRVVDGAYGSRFMTDLAATIESL
jgi:pyruvate dehydrogenase E2 component (dihydrolipoamide acetyltransferase)